MYTNNLTVRNNIVHGFIETIQKMDKIPENIVSFYKKVVFEKKISPLHAFDCLMIRKDPPINPLVLNFLDAIKDEVVIINDVDGIRKANNKLYTTTFHDPNNTFLPKTHVSGSKKFIKKTIEESDQEKMILKPLDGSGGKGVIVLEKNARENINSLLDFYIDQTGDNYVILQEFIEGIESGDVRVLMLNGQMIGAYNRKPADGEIRANIQTGGTAHKYTLSESQKKVCKKVGNKLVADGLYFVGLDMIGDKILEVNVLNPGGITNINKLDKTKLHRLVVDFIEDKVNEKVERRVELEYLLKRITELRQ
jgi:glutathione synthase